MSASAVTAAPRPVSSSRILGGDRATEEAANQKARDILAFFGLQEMADELASNLAHGHQRALGVAVALAADPKLMLLDEPFTGMNAGRDETDG